jgi:hypothetical protein
MCKKEIKKRFLIEQNKIQKLLELENQKKGIKTKRTFFKKQIEEEDSDEDEINSKKKVVNLFIGRFDVEKFFNKEQVIEFKQGSFVNAFIFKDKSNTENKIETKHQQKEISVYKNKKKNNTTELKNLNDGRKSNFNSAHRFGSLSYIHHNRKPFMFLNKTNQQKNNNINKNNNKNSNLSIKEEYSTENTKEEKFDKKKLILHTQSDSSSKNKNKNKIKNENENKKNNKSNSNNIDNNLFIKTLIKTKKHNIMSSEETLKTFNTLTETKRLNSDIYLPNIFDKDNKSSYNKKMKKDKIIYFLKKKDFYY